MDPTACLRDTLAALIVARSTPRAETEVTLAAQTAIDGLRNLADWLERGGFAPDVERVLDELR